MILDALHKIANHGSSLTRDEAHAATPEGSCGKEAESPGSCP